MTRNTLHLVVRLTVPGEQGSSSSDSPGPCALRGTCESPGACGLLNLGNTCLAATFRVVIRVFKRVFQVSLGLCVVVSSGR